MPIIESYTTTSYQTFLYSIFKKYLEVSDLFILPLNLFKTTKGIKCLTTLKD